MILNPETRDREISNHYDVVVIGSGFGSLFFILGLLRRSKVAPKILILERGNFVSHSDQIEAGANSNILTNDTIEVPTGHKPWNFTIGVGGGTLCWWGQTPRMHPSDFQTHTKYGVGKDWPLSYEELESYYCDAEEIIGVSGDSDRVGPFWRSRPYPMPAHLPSSVDAKMRRVYSEQLAIPNARVSVTDGPRPQCCSVGNCRLCPNDAKFTALNGLGQILNHPAISIITGAEVKMLSTQGGKVRSAVCVIEGKQHSVTGDLFVLGANSIFNAAILTRSAISHLLLGKGINEQVGCHLEVQLSSLSGVDGGTATTGVFCGFLDGAHRRNYGATMVFFDNRWKYYGLRKEFKNLLGKVLLAVNAEDVPQLENFVETPADWSKKPIIHHAKHSSYGEMGIQNTIKKLPSLLAPLGIDNISEPERRLTESHILGTTPMGKDPAHSIVDKNLIHHIYRNLALVGTSVFPTCPVANPSLTAAALSLRAATNLVS